MGRGLGVSDLERRLGRDSLSLLRVILLELGLPERLRDKLRSSLFLVRIGFLARSEEAPFFLRLSSAPRRRPRLLSEASWLEADVSSISVALQFSRLLRSSGGNFALFARLVSPCFVGVAFILMSIMCIGMECVVVDGGRAEWARQKKRDVLSNQSRGFVATSIGGKAVMANTELSQEPVK